MAGTVSFAELTARTGCGAAGFRALLRLVRGGQLRPIHNERITSATVAGLLVDEWTPERIRGLEASLYIGFNVGGKKSAQSAATDGIGRSIPDLEIHAPLPALPVAGSTSKNLDLPDASPGTQPWSITE